MKGKSKKVLMLIFAFVLVFTLALGACGKKEAKKDDPTTKKQEETTTTKKQEETTTTAAAQQQQQQQQQQQPQQQQQQQQQPQQQQQQQQQPQQQQQQPQQPEPQPQPAQQFIDDSDPQAEQKNAAMYLLTRYNRLLYVDGCGLDADDSVLYYNGDVSYRKVVDQSFQNFGHIYNYLVDTMTVAAAGYYFPRLVDMSIDTYPPYVYVSDGSAPEGLYELQAGRGIYPYEFQYFNSVTVESDTMFTASMQVLYFGEPITLQMGCVREDGMWKISSIER